MTFLKLKITAAEQEYSDLKKVLSHLSRISTRQSEKKLEEGVNEENDFNLSDFLHGMSNDQQEAGHEPKHLGVVWKNLTVEVLNQISCANMICCHIYIQCNLLLNSPI